MSERMPLATIQTFEHRPLTVSIDGYPPTQTQEIALTLPGAREFLEPAAARALARLLVKLADVVDEARAVNGADGRL